MGRPLTTHQPTYQWVEGSMEHIFGVSSRRVGSGAAAPGTSVGARPWSPGGGALRTPAGVLYAYARRVRGQS